MEACRISGLCIVAEAYPLDSRISLQGMEGTAKNSGYPCHSCRFRVCTGSTPKMVSLAEKLNPGGMAWAVCSVRRGSRCSRGTYRHPIQYSIDL
jgi:hypothetical protein